jgi:RNA ligase
MGVLTTRDQFREAVFARDSRTCVVCSLPGVDAHHIMERRLFPDGGYYLNNGVTLCTLCHYKAETTEIDCTTLRQAAGITEIVLPPHFFPDGLYDKWGNQILDNGMRMKGELFAESSVQKVLADVMYLFSDKVKYPRTMHFPWSPNLQNDDRMLQSTAGWEGQEYVFTEKMDGEGTTFYTDDLHARSLEFEQHPSRTFIKAIHAACAYDIPKGYRICGENMTAVHSIKYHSLPSYFMVFNIWRGATCLSWDETVEWTTLLGLTHVPVLYRGAYSDELCQRICASVNLETEEGVVARPARALHMREFPFVVGKYVRRGHVQTDQHWMQKEVEFNGLKEQ